MTVRNFETTCDACHGSQILGEGRAGAKGIPFFTLPGLDVETLQEANVDIGEWPEGAEEEITPFMRFLLLANPKFKKLEADLGDADLLDLVDAGKAQLAAAGNLAWAVKGTLFELVSKGQKGLKEQLERALGRSLSAFELSSLSGLLPNDLVRSAQRSWLPRLFVEMARRSEKDLKEEDEKKKEEPEGEGGEEDAEEAPADEETSIAGGWYVQDYSLFYKPSGHKDLFLASWLNLTGERKRAEPSEDVKGQIFTALSDRKSPGLCGKCHSVDEEKDGSLKVNWIERRPAINVKEFNRYRHSPHFSLLDEKGCLTCHILNSDADYLGSFKDFDPATFASNFQAIPKAVCVNCHTTEGAVSTCQTCHNYHIGKTMPALISAPMQMPGATR